MESFEPELAGRAIVTEIYRVSSRPSERGEKGKGNANESLNFLIWAALHCAVPSSGSLPLFESCLGLKPRWHVEHIATASFLSPDARPQITAVRLAWPSLRDANCSVLQGFLFYVCVHMCVRVHVCAFVCVCVSACMCAFACMCVLCFFVLQYDISESL